MGYITLGILLFFLVGIGAGSAQPDRVKEVREKHEAKLLAIEGVAGVYDDEETGELVVMVEEEKHIGKVPKKLEDVDVRIEVTGKIWALDSAAARESLFQPMQRAAQQASYSRTGINRPVFAGISLGNSGYPFISGTLGLVVTGTGQQGTVQGAPYVLSNAHVLALDSNAHFLPLDGSTQVWQPGGADTGAVGYPIGALKNYVKINFDTNEPALYNTADAAIGTLTTTYRAPGDVLNSRNNGFYRVTGPAVTVIQNDVVRKSGRTTGVTTGRVLSTSGTVQVWYTSSDWANFRDQIITTKMVKSGDSGSPVDKNGKFVGLVFAGSSTNAIICKAENILGPLGVQLSS